MTDSRSKIKLMGSVVGAVGGLAGIVGALTGWQALDVSRATLDDSRRKEHLETLSKANKLNELYGDNYRKQMSFFTRYQKDSERKGSSYTEAFKIHSDPVDQEAEEFRGSLAGFWDMVLDDHEMGLLPADFFLKDHGRWLQLAKNYKALVEPVDVANYERLGFDKSSSGPYLKDNNRPSRYVRIEKLVEAADKAKAGSHKATA